MLNILLHNRAKVSKLLTAIVWVLSGTVGMSSAQPQSLDDLLDHSQIADKLILEEGDWLADIGAGSGSYFHHFTERIDKSGHVFAVDIDKNALAELHENLSSPDYPSVTPVYSVEENPLLPSSSFDALFMRNAYHEFSEPLEMLRHFEEALKPGGRLVILDTIDEELTGEERNVQEDEHRLDIELAKADLKEAGFEIVTSKPNWVSHPHSDTIFLWLLVAEPPE